MSQPQVIPLTSITGSTPIKKNPLHTRHYRFGSAPEARLAQMLANIGPKVHEITLKAFEKNALPPLLFDIDLIVARLRNDGVLLDQGFRHMVKDSTEQKARETLYYAPLKQIHDKVIQAAKAIHPPGSLAPLPILEYRVCGDMKPVSERVSTSRPDGYQVIIRGHTFHSAGPNKAPSDDDWLDIPRSDEYKKGNNEDDLLDNIAKVCWSAHHVMRNDPRRRFTFGLTIEKTDTRMWFFNRQVALVSEPFDYMKNPKHFIRLVLSLSFADPIELGFDPSMKLIGPGNPFQYSIEVDGAVYRTIRPLSNFQADALRGRATRVFLAEEVTLNNLPTKRLVVIKDIWVDEDRETEGKLHEDLLRELPQEFHKYFLTVVKYCIVQVNGRADNTLSVHLRGIDLEAEKSGFLATVKEPSALTKTSHSASQGVPPEANLPAPPAGGIIYYPKVHYRIVFKEVCTPLEAIRDWPTVLRALSETVEVLIAMYNHGRWVHRDLSTGNILIHDASGQVKVGDLEFIQKTHTGQPHGMRTGTIEFMSIELQSQQYMFRPPAPRGGLKSNQKKVWKHNALHDLESVWWIFMRFLFRFIPKGRYELQDLQDQLNGSLDVFPDAFDIQRQNKFYIADAFFDLQPLLANGFCQTALFDFADKFRAELIWAYQEAEKNLYSTGEIVFDHFPDTLETIRQLFKTGIPGLELCPELVHLQQLWHETNSARVGGGTTSDKRSAPEGGSGGSGGGGDSKKSRNV